MYLYILFNTWIKHNSIAFYCLTVGIWNLIGKNRQNKWMVGETVSTLRAVFWGKTRTVPTWKNGSLRILTPQNIIKTGYFEARPHTIQVQTSSWFQVGATQLNATTDKLQRAWRTVMDIRLAGGGWEPKKKRRVTNRNIYSMLLGSVTWVSFGRGNLVEDDFCCWFLLLDLGFPT